jgi:hypothetical protein
MKFLNRFIIILTLLLIVSLGSVKAETLEEITKELNDIKESISKLDTSEVKEAVVIDKALNEITKAVDFVNDKVNAGDIKAAVSAVNFANQAMSDIATSALPKEFDTEVIKKGEDFSAEKMAEIVDITGGLTANKEEKTQKLVQDMIEANVKGLDTFAISESLNEIGIKTINSGDFAKTIAQTELARPGQELRRTRDISKELEDQVRFGAIIGTSAEEVDLALRQVEVIREGDPRKIRAFEIEKYGKALGLSADAINKGVQAVYSGDIETEKQVSLEIINAMKESPDWKVNIEINDAVMNDFMAEEIAKEKVVYAVMNNKAFGALDTSAYKEGVVVHDVYGYIDAQKGHQQTISEFANEVGNYLASVGSIDSDTIRDVKYQINRQSVNGLSSKTIGAMVMAELEGDEYKDAYYAIDRSWTDFEARGIHTLAYSAAKVEAILMNDRYAHTTATYSNDYAVKLTDSQQSDISKVYDNALGQIDKQNAVIALEAVKQTTQIATKTVHELTPKVDSLEAKVESLTSDKNYLTIKAEVDEVKEYREKLMKDLTEKKINHPEYFAKISSKQAGVSHDYLAKSAEFVKLQSEIDKAKRALSSTKNSLAITKNAMNTATQNAAAAGVSVEIISQVVSSTAGKASVVAAKASQAAQVAATKAAQQAAEKSAITSQKVAEQAAAKATEAATAKVAEEVSAAAASKAAEQAKAASKAAEQAAAKASQAAQVAATKAAQQAADAATKASQQAAEAAARQAAKAAATAAQEEAQQAAKQAAAVAAKTAATEVAKKAAAAAQQAAQQAKEAAAQAAQAAASDAAEAAATAAKQAAQQAAQQLATAAIEAAKQQVANSAAAASVAAQSAAKEAAKVAQQKSHMLDPDTFDAAHLANQKIAQEAQAAAKEAAENATQAAATATAAQEAVQGIASISKEALSEAQKAAKEAVELATTKATAEVVEQAKAEITKEARDAARDAAIAAAKEVTGEVRAAMSAKEVSNLRAEIQSHIQDIYNETGIGMSSKDPNYEKVNAEFSKKSWDEKKAVFDKLNELKKAKQQAAHGQQGVDY